MSSCSICREGNPDPRGRYLSMDEYGTTSLALEPPVQPEGQGETTKRCPRCGMELFSDMDVCYGCLFDFSRAGSSGPDLPPQDDLDEPRGWDEGMPPFELEENGRTLELSGMPLGARTSGIPSVWVRGSELEVVVPIPEDGLNVGRLPSNDVVLHSAAASRRHLRVSLVSGGAVAEDQGSTNPAMLRGRAVDDLARMQVGDTLDVCGTLLTLVGPVPS